MVHGSWFDVVRCCSMLFDVVRCCSMLFDNGLIMV